MNLATLTFDVDLGNPGQFLACCGLLELACRLSPSSTAKFEKNQFLVTECHIDLIGQFLAADARADDEYIPPSEAGSEVEDRDGDSDKSPPIRFAAPFNLRLDWWTEVAAVRAGFKTWAGGQTVLGFVGGMRQCIRDQNELGSSLLQRTMPIRQPKPFYFDARLSRLTALDAGFSTEKFTSVYSPATELLALVGLQRFRPAAVEPRERYAYSVWSDNLPPSIAAAVAHGLIPSLISKTYQFPLVVRTGGKYKAFGPSTPDRRTNE
jgi:CRISPR-associated protein Csb3